MSITRDSVVVVHEGLVSSVHVLKSLGELLAILLFQMLAPAKVAALFWFPLFSGFSLH